MARTNDDQIYNAQPLLDEASSKNAINSDKEEPELEIEPSEITIFPQCYQNNPITLLSEAYHLVYGGPKNLLNSFDLTNIKTPMENTVLHIASWYGNDEIVTLVIERDPKLLFTFNKNKDSALHVAARGGHISTVKKLLSSYANFERREIALAWLNYKHELEDYDDVSNMEDLLEFVKEKNVHGNNMVHEAMLCGNKTNIGGDKIFEIIEIYKTEDRYGNSLAKCCYEEALYVVNNANKSVLYLAVENGKKDAVELILEKCHNNIKPKGLSPVVAAIMKHNLEILRILLEKKPALIHSKDKHERVPLHYVASIGYLEGVDLLLGICINCTIQRDKYGYFPIHLASYGGHVEVVNKLLEYCPDPKEMLDTCHDRNILHIAANYGKYELVQNILQSQTPELHKMINQRDKEGNTPLHLAARSCHPTTVYYLIWNERVDVNVVNQNNETPLDVVSALYEVDKSSLRLYLTWTALKSAGAKQSPRKPSESNSQKTEESNQKIKTEQKQSNEKEKASERYKDRIENLTVVSTLIVTTSVAAC